MGYLETRKQTISIYWNSFTWSVDECVQDFDISAMEKIP